MIKKYWSIILSVKLLLFSYLKQKYFIDKYIKPILVDVLQNDQTLPSTQKILFNYATLVPALLGEAFCVLRGYKMSFNERLGTSYQSAFSAIGDHFFDESDSPSFTVNTLFSRREMIEGKTAGERLFLDFYNRYYELNMRNEFEFYFEKIHEAEELSQIQEMKDTDIKEIEKVTQQKGGYSILFYRTAFEHKIESSEKELLYKLGETIQLANDAFDIYKDYKSGIRTLITECADFSPFITHYLNLIQEVVALAYETNFTKAKIRVFLNIMSLSVFSRTLVCLNRLNELQQTTGGKFLIHAYSRKQLICDMEKGANIFESFRWFKKLNYEP